MASGNAQKETALRGGLQNLSLLWNQHHGFQKKKTSPKYLTLLWTGNLRQKILGRLKKKCAIFWMWQSWPMIYNTGGLWCATRWFADQMCSWGKKKCTAQLNLPTINNLFLTQLLSEATREQALFLWLDESCMCFERSKATLCLYPRWMNSITKNMPKFTSPSCHNQHFCRLDVISVYYLQFSELFNPQMKRNSCPKIC